MKKSKKCLAVVLSLLMVISLIQGFGTSMCAADASYTYNSSTDTVTLTAEVPGSVTIGAEVSSTPIIISGDGTYINYVRLAYVYQVDYGYGVFDYDGKSWRGASETFVAGVHYGYAVQICYIDTNADHSDVKLVLNGKTYTDLASYGSGRYIAIVDFGKATSSGTFVNGDFTPAHDHSWVYSTSYDSTSGMHYLSAYCSASGCWSETSSSSPVTFSAHVEDKSYTGKAYVGYTSSGQTAWTNADLEEPTVTYVGRGTTTYSSTTAPTDIGTYTLKITPAGATETSTNTISADFEITIGKQSAPASGIGYTLSYANETLVAQSGYEVSSTNGTTATALADNAITPGNTYYVRRAAKTNYEASAWTTITLSGRASAPTGIEGSEVSEAGQSDGKITGVTTAMEYSSDNGGTWTAVSGTEITGLAAGTYLVRTAATGSAFASAAASVTVGTHLHSLTKVNGQAATCTSDGWKDYYECTCGKLFADAEGTTVITDLDTYKTGSGKVESTGHSWVYTTSGSDYIVTCENDPSETATLTLTAPTITYDGTDVKVNDWTDEQKAAWEALGLSLPEVSVTYEYKETSDGTYSTASDNNTAGYYRATATIGGKSVSVEYQIKKESTEAPAEDEGYTVDYVNETIIAGDTYEVSTTNGDTATPLTDNKLEPGKTYYVRVKGTVNAEPSAWVAIMIPERDEAPSGYTVNNATSDDANDGSITGLSDDMEYSTDGGVTWTTVTNGEITGIGSDPVLIRTKATDDTLASDYVTVGASHTHEYPDEWTDVKTATETTAGCRTKVCTSCGKTLIETVPKTGDTDSDPYDGRVIIYTEIDSDVAADIAFINNSVKDLDDASGIFTEAEKEAIANGAEASVYIVVDKKATTDLSSDDISKITDAAKTAVDAEPTTEYLDITLYKKVGDADPVPITEPGIDIEIILDIPASMVNSDDDVIRTYSIVRLHDGAAEALAVAYDDDENEITFSSNQFSTYAIAYGDKAVDEDKSDDQGDDDEDDNKGNNGNNGNNGNSGDSDDSGDVKASDSSYRLLIVLLMASALVLTKVTGFSFRRRRTSKR